MNKPQRKIMGNRKKFEKVCASKTSLTETATNNPRKVEVTAIKRTLIKAKNQLMPERSIRKEAKRTGMKPLITPKMMVPVVLASIKRFRLMGASNNRSKERFFLSKVIVTASIEVVPNKTDKAMTPGRIPLMSTAPPERIKNMSVHETGKIIPQLMLGGFK